MIPGEPQPTTLPTPLRPLRGDDILSPLELAYDPVDTSAAYLTELAAVRGALQRHRPLALPELAHLVRQRGRDDAARRAVIDELRTNPALWPPEPPAEVAGTLRLRPQPQDVTLTAARFGELVLVNPRGLGLHVTTLAALQRSPAVPVPLSALDPRDLDTIFTGITRAARRARRSAQPRADDAGLHALLRVLDHMGWRHGDARQHVNIITDALSELAQTSAGLTEHLNAGAPPATRVDVTWVQPHPGRRGTSPARHAEGHALLRARAARELWQGDLEDVMTRLRVAASRLGELPDSDPHPLSGFVVNRARYVSMIADGFNTTITLDTLDMLGTARYLRGTAPTPALLATLDALTRGPQPQAMVVAAHDELARLIAQHVPPRQRSLGAPGHPGLDADVDTGRSAPWTFRRARTHGELHARGQAHHHCVGSASYGVRAERGEIDLVLMNRGRRGHLTLEIERGAVVQALGPRNREPQPLEVVALRAWAAHAGLDLGELGLDPTPIPTGTVVTPVHVPPARAEEDSASPEQHPDTAASAALRSLAARVLARTEREERAIGALLARRRSQLARREKARASSLGW